MNKTMKKIYESPSTTHVRVEMEGRLCAGSANVTNPDKKDFGRIDEQGVGNTYDFKDSGWGTDPTVQTTSN